jgi:CubicO group peptidase (beta-lactamase class C family)
MAALGSEQFRCWLGLVTVIAEPATTTEAAMTATTETNDVDSTMATPLQTASPTSVGFFPVRLDRLDNAMQAEIEAGHYAGISLMVARHGKLVKFRRYGFQTLERREPMREDAIFRIASMTKPIIGAAMMSLYEEGRWQHSTITSPRSFPSLPTCRCSRTADSCRSTAR